MRSEQVVNGIPSPVPPGWGRDWALSNAVPEPSDTTSLNVALYPYVPDPVWYEETVQTAWMLVHPDVALNFIQYDCYAGDPPPTLDVFGFDAIFAQYFMAMKFLQPMPEADISDYFAWALQGLIVDGKRLVAAPYLGCMNVMIYSAEDSQLGAPGLTVELLENILGDSSDSSPCPLPGEGLLLDLTGGTTDACLYLQIGMQDANQFPVNPHPPACPSGLDPTALPNLHAAVRIAGHKQVTYVDASGYQRLIWFLNGFGRGYVGSTEAMAFIPPGELGEYAFRPLPFSSAPVTTNPVFVNAMGVNQNVDPGKTSLAVDLALMVASPTVTTTALAGRTNPQYLTPVRASVLNALAARFPMYRQIQQVLQQVRPAGFRIGPMSRQWLNATKCCLASQIVGPEIEIDESEFEAPGYRSSPGGLWRKP